MARRQRRPGRKLLSATVLLAAAVALVPAYVRAYTISGASAAPTLLLGDRVLVNLGSYDVRFPYTDCVLVHRGDPELGDLVLVESPDGGRPIFKRIVALPGDRVAMEARHLTINGHPLKYTRADNKPWASAALENMLGSVMEREGIGRLEHLITYTPGPAANSSFPEAPVPPDHYYLLGDNRDHSWDSRVWGPVSRKSVRGRVIATPTRR